MKSANRMNRIIRLVVVFFGMVAMISCVEELDIENISADSETGLLVIETSLSDLPKRQQVYLSRSDMRLDLETDTIYNPAIPLGQGPRDSVLVEENALVRVVGSDGSAYNFSEEVPGTYLSNQEFALQLGTSYQVEVTTSDNKEYVSESVQIQGVSEISNVYAERIFNDVGVEGIAIFVDSNPQQGTPSNYRYTYDETYKIIAPNWHQDDFELTNYEPCALPVPTYDLEIVAREIENRVCYNTVSSNTIEQISTNSSDSNRVDRFMVRFVNRNDFIITHRYSILVRQLVQSPNAFSYYETLKQFSETESLFSAIQPGALIANVTRTDGTKENVLGYVEAVSVSEQRLFFDYEDFFAGEALPPYPEPCFDQSSPESHRSFCASGPDGGNPCPQSIIERINLGLIAYTGVNDRDLGTCPGPYTYVPRICGDCTLLGENEVPEFWEE